MKLSHKQQKNLQKKIKDPVWFSKNIMGGSQPWNKQVEIMEAVRDHKRVAVRSGNGVGKTFISARIVLWFLLAYYPAKVITTAPTWNQVEKLLWTELAAQYNNSKIPLGGTLLKTELRFDDDHFAVGLSTNNETAFQGHHSKNILMIFDEALGVEPPIWNAAEGNLTSENAKWLAIGNPVAPAGKFYDCFTSPVWHKIKISCLDSPNVINDNHDIPGLVTREWIEERKKEWGEKSGIYKSRVLGDFPTEGDDTLIPLSWVERALEKKIEQKDDIKISLGVDVARFGSDSTVFVVMRGNEMLHINGYIGKDTTKTTGEAIRLSRAFNCDIICIDDTGVGGGVTDMLNEQHFNVLPVNFGSSAVDKDKFDNLKTEIFWNLREDFENERISVKESPKLLQEIPTLLYEMTSRGKMRIIGKDKMRKMGLKSPDYADALVIAHYGTYANHRGILDFYKEQQSNVQETPQQQIISQFLQQGNLENLVI